MTLPRASSTALRMRAVSTSLSGTAVPGARHGRALAACVEPRQHVAVADRTTAAPPARCAARARRRTGSPAARQTHRCNGPHGPAGGECPACRRPARLAPVMWPSASTHTRPSLSLPSDVAGPVQAQQQLVRAAPAVSAFSMLRADCVTRCLRAGRSATFDAGQVEHAHAVAVGPEQRRAGAAVDAGVVEEMFAPVQPHRLQLGQRGADGGGAHGALRQVHPHAGDQVGPRVVPVDRAVDVDHHAAGVGEDGEVAGVGHGPRERLDHRRGGLQQRLVGVERAVAGTALETASNAMRCCGLKPCARQRRQERSIQASTAAVSVTAPSLNTARRALSISCSRFARCVGQRGRFLGAHGLSRCCSVLDDSAVISSKYAKPPCFILRISASTPAS